MQIEYVARIGLASRWAAEQERNLAVCRSLLGKIVIDHECMSARVTEMLAECRARIWSNKLKRRRVGGRCSNDRCVLIRALLFELRSHVRNGRCFLADGDVNAIHRIYSAGLSFRRVSV